MRKSVSALLSLLLCVSLLAGLTVPVLAAPAAADLTIGSEEEFLDFAARCRLDSYSRDLTVRLEADLDLTGLDFEGIPIFCGFFDGNGHRITGLSLTGSGSDQGFFRYLTDTARVEDLTVSGTVSPAGSSKSVGGLVGRNEGLISHCFFNGAVSGAAQVGGIAGENTVTGVIEGCVVTGSVTGSHFVGGIAGANSGLLRSCTNRSQVCTEPQDDAVDLSQVSLHTVTGSESVTAVTDIGGIAGTNNGFIRACQNSEAVGYPHVGYNIGGIAGSQKGSMEDCRNFASVSGRKEVGGIVGQLEPVSRIEYEEDSLQILRQQLGQTIALADQASANASGSAAAITGQLDAIREHTKNAKEAAGQMILRPDRPLPDLDQLKAASSTLTSSLTGMKDSTVSLGRSTEAALTGLTGDLQALVSSMKTMQSTINHVSENLGGTVTDVSDQDTEEDFTAEISGCENLGRIQGDLNVGGVTGAIAQENDLDPEDDLQFTGELSLNFSGELRAVIRDCSNQGDISGKKWNIGGIVGAMRLGLVHSCTSAGTVQAEGADYVGGVAGQSAGFLRSCSAKSQLSGRSWVGGIAGTAQIVTDCRSMASIDSAVEKTGAVVGQVPAIRLKDQIDLAGNVYFPACADPGGIDGVSYEGAAVPLTQEAFFGLPALSPIFSQAAIRFVFDDGAVKTVQVPTGGALPEDAVPAVPEQAGATLEWEGLANSDTDHIYFDRVYRLRATPCQTTLESSRERDSGRPLALIEGLFAESTPFEMQPLEEQPPLDGKQTFLESWSLPRLPSTARVRISLSRDWDPALVCVYLRSADSSWRQAETEISGSYLALDAGEQDDALALVQQPAPFPWGLWLGGGAGAAACMALVLFLLIRRSRQKRRKA